MNRRNRYGHLRIDFLDDAAPIEIQHTWTLTESREERISIYTSELPDNHWVYGYMVYWKNGRVSNSRPSAENGLFRSQRDAKLFAVGFMLMYLEYFTPETQSSLLSAESSLLQASLF